MATFTTRKKGNRRRAMFWVAILIIVSAVGAVLPFRLADFNQLERELIQYFNEGAAFLASAMWIIQLSVTQFDLQLRSVPTTAAYGIRVATLLWALMWLAVYVSAKNVPLADAYAIPASAASFIVASTLHYITTIVGEMADEEDPQGSPIAGGFLAVVLLFAIVISIPSILTVAGVVVSVGAGVFVLLFVTSVVAGGARCRI